MMTSECLNVLLELSYQTDGSKCAIQNNESATVINVTKSLSLSTMRHYITCNHEYFLIRILSRLCHYIMQDEDEDLHPDHYGN